MVKGTPDEVEQDASFNEGTVEPNRRKSIQSVEVGIRILIAMSQTGSSLRLREIAEMSGLSRSQTHRYLLSYVNTGMVRQVAENGNYELGPLAITVGMAALRSSEPVVVGGQALGRLVEHTGFTGLLSVWGQFGPTIIRIKPGRRHMVMALQVGSVVSALGSSAGQVFLAHLPDTIAAEVARDEWRGAPGDSPNGWRAVLAQYRHEVLQSGYAAADNITLPGLAAISAPIFDCQGSLALVMTLLGRAADHIGDDADVIRSLLDATADASYRLGYSANTDFESF